MRNLPPTVSDSEIEEEFQQFGNIRPDGVVIRGRKVLLSFFLTVKFKADCWPLFVVLKCVDIQDLGVCYAFVEFEDMDGVHNAVKVCSCIGSLFILY